MKPTLGLTRPTDTETARVAAKLEDGEARLVVDMPASLHRRLKIRAIERGQTIREYVLELLEREGLTR